MVDYAKETRGSRGPRAGRLLAQLEVAVTALQAAVDKLSAAIREHYDKVAEIDRLRVHVKDNILYYMQAIWSHEPPDQRFFRLYNLDVPVIVPRDTTGEHRAQGDTWIGARGSGTRSAAATPPTSTSPMPTVDVEWKKLVEVADLDNVLGYKGNYMIFPLKENNYITLHMMQDYLDVGDELLLRDPDETGDYTIDELQRPGQVRTRHRQGPSTRTARKS